MVHSGKKAKQKLRKKSKLQLIAVLMYMLTVLAMTNPKAYKSVEKRLGLTGKLSKKKSKKRKSKRKPATKGKKRKGKGRPKKGQVPPQLRKYLFMKGHKPVRKKKR